MNEHRTELQKTPMKDTFYTVCYDGTPQTEVNGEFTLPDYLPDTRRLLRCSAVPEITGKFTDGEKMEFEGSVHASVVYMAEDGTIQIFEATLPFSQHISMPMLGENSVITVHCITEQAQCRLSGPRKLHLRIRVKMPCRVLSETNAEPTVQTADGKVIPVCMQKETVPVCSIGVSEVVTRSYAEDIPSGTEDAAMRAVLSMAITPHTTECRMSDNEVVCAGEFLISALCVLTDADGGESCKPLHARIPFSERLMLEGEVSNGAVALPDITVRDVRYAPSDDGTVCALDFSMELSALCMSDGESQTVTDAFFPAHDVKAEYERADIYRAIKTANGNFAISGGVPYDGDDSIEKVIDTACKIKLDSYTQNGSKLTLSGQMEVSAIAMSADGKYLPIAGTIPATWDTDLGTKEAYPSLICHTEAHPTSFACRMDEGSRALVCEAEIAVLTSIGCVEPRTRIASLTVTENNANTRKDDYPILLYYPAEGERIWDIAKAYHVTPDALHVMNDLSQDVEVVPKDSHVLLIPSKEEAVLQ